MRQPHKAPGTDGCFDSALILSPFFWNFRDDIPGTTHYIAAELARVVPTILVEPIPRWDVRSEQFRMERFFRGVAGRRTSNVASQLTVFHRRALPFGRLSLVRNWDLRRNARAIRRVLSPLNFRRTLLWHSFPYWSEPLVDSLDHVAMVYHCLDFTTRLEECRLVRRADTVFAVSEALVRKLTPLNPRVHHLPNGVDLDLFDSQRVLREPRPADLPSGVRLIGFVGKINRYLDIDLLLKVAEAFPRDMVVVVGSLTTNETAPSGTQMGELRALESLPNVRLLGFRPASAVPAYVQAFDVCLIPYLSDPFNLERDPLKFYEYFAMGKSVVTTAVPVAERYRELCYLARSHPDFISQVGHALDQPGAPGVGDERMAVARAHGWRALVRGALATVCGEEAR